jgi:hypothetical protein
MFKEKFIEQKSFEKIPEITEEVIEEEIKKDPEKFIGWFKSIKDSIADWPEKFLKNKSIRNAIIYASIPFAVLEAGMPKAKAEDVVSEFARTDDAVYEQVETKPGVPQIKPEDLTGVEEEGREVLAEKINQELAALNELDNTLNEEIEKKIDLFPQDIIEKAREKDFFNISNRVWSKIEEADKTEKSKSELVSFIKNGKLNFKKVVEIFPETFAAENIALVAHEIGHGTEALKHGAKKTETSFDPFKISRKTKWFGDVKNEAAVVAAGINADKRFGEFLVNNLREEDTPSQFLALMAIIAKSDGMGYVLRSQFSEKKRQTEDNDIVNYAKETNTPISELAIGLTADFILDRDNWKLIKIIFGEKGIKIPKTTISPMYELSESGPVIGLKFKGVW